MIPWELVDQIETPGGQGRLSLHRRGEEYSIRIDGQELMNSRMHGSEEAMAELACGALTTPRPRVLIGGLGMGFTLAASARVLPAGARIEVVELMAAVVEWNRGPLGALAGDPLNDRRVLVCVDDVRALLERSREHYDAILLDVDNGPNGLTQPENQWLYEPVGLARIKKALKSGGVLSVWSARDDRRFTQRLNAAGFSVTAHRVSARAGSKGSKHTIWIAEGAK